MKYRVLSSALWSVLLVTLPLAPAAAEGLETDISGVFELEYRRFFQDGTDPAQGHDYVSFSAEATFEYFWDRGDQNIVFTPFGRFDAQDDHRTHVDIRELRYERVFEYAEIRIGFDKVFWGVTEIAHLIDVINQTDMIESLDGEEKLGQPMVNLTVPSNWGTLNFYYLPYFRERTFEDHEGRPRGPLRINSDLATYEDGDKEWNPDFAVRWNHYIGAWDIGVSHFSGTGRNPVLSPAIMTDGEVVLRPTYVQIDQTSLDVQATLGAWLLKFEGLSRNEVGERYIQATGGFEYSFYGVFDTPADLGVVGEYIYDERGARATTPFQNDAFVGLRWAANDVQSTAVLAGGFHDLGSSAWGVSLEAERRLGSDYFLTIETRFFFDAPQDDPLSFIANDDFLQVRLARYF